jgi:hypothetical protein
MQSAFDLLGTPRADLAFRLAIDLACVLVLIRLIYYRTYRRADLFLTFFSFNLVIFLIAYVLNSTEMSLGAAFGLFAVFSMLRYRTEGISATDMTYLFLGIALGLMLAVSSAGPLGLALIGGIVLACTALLESGLLAKREVRQEVVYDRIELVDARRRDELLEDLRARTGLNVERVRVEEIDLVKDSAKLVLYSHADAPLAPRRQTTTGDADPRALARSEHALTGLSA